MSAKRKNTYQAGLVAEILAALYLFFKGYRLLAWRYKCLYGEVDLIAMSRDCTIVFVEVKERNSLDAGLSAITPQMKNRISTAAKSWTAHNAGYATCAMRFDVIAISLPFSIRHMDNAWQSGS